MKHVICTPINIKNPSTEHGKIARKDYFREKAFFHEHGRSKYDDSRYNLAKVGDLFCFVHASDDIMEVFFIVAIGPSRHRPEYWNISNHKPRNVLYLSQKKGEFSWKKFKTMAGYQDHFRLQGTQRFRCPESFLNTI